MARVSSARPQPETDVLASDGEWHSPEVADVMQPWVGYYLIPVLNIRLAIFVSVSQMGRHQTVSERASSDTNGEREQTSGAVRLEKFWYGRTEYYRTPGLRSFPAGGRADGRTGWRADMTLFARPAIYKTTSGRLWKLADHLWLRSSPGGRPRRGASQSGRPMDVVVRVSFVLWQNGDCLVVAANAGLLFAALVLVSCYETGQIETQ